MRRTAETKERPDTSAVEACPRCGTHLRRAGRFCAHCGAPVFSHATGEPGRVMHPHPFPAPEGFQGCKRSCDLFFRWRHGADQRMLGTETITIDIFNAGYGLRNLSFLIEGRTAQGETVSKENEIAGLNPGETEAIEVPSYELPGQVESLEVSLRSAEFANETPGPTR